MSPNPQLIRWSFSVVERRADQLSRYFYTHLFHHNPELRSMFPERMDEQRDRLFAAFAHAATTVDDPRGLVGYLRTLGYDHRKFGVRPDQYPLLGESLIATLRTFSGDAWSAEVEEAWRDAYAMISDVMIAAAEEAARSGLPPWWEAEVVRHERRTEDIAVLTVLPHLSYPYRPGQYATLTVPQVPQVWRPYSIANAPRLDNTLDFHVRRVPGGMVSTALTEELVPGARLRLGPAIGTMTLPRRVDRDLLCVAGGTGWAPVKAVIEAVADLPEPRSVTLFLGVRSEDEVYDIDDLERLAKTCEWLDVVPVLPPLGGAPEVADAELLRQLGEYAPRATGRDAFVCGPPAMVRAVEDELRAGGFDERRIRRDVSVRHFGTERPVSAADRFLVQRDVPWIRAQG